MSSAELANGRTKSVLLVSVIALLVGNALALAGYDSGSSASTLPEPPTAGAGPGTDAGPSATSTTVPSGTAAPPAASKGGKQATTTTSTAPPPTTTPALANYDYQVTIEPSCVAVGEELTITLKLDPWSSAIMYASYADGQNHDTWHANTALEDGRIVHKWKAPPVPGEAAMWTRAADREQKRQGEKIVYFRIVQVPGTC